MNTNEIPGEPKKELETEVETLESEIFKRNRLITCT